MKFQKSLKDMGEGLALYHVWLYQAYHEVSSKYKRTVLGSVWISGAMLATSIALAIVMGGIQGQSLPDILPYIMGGILCFALPAYILNEAPDVYINSANIIKNHAHPFTYYTFESVSRTFIIFFHNILAFYLVILLLQKAAIPHWSLLPGLVLVFANCVFWGPLISMIASRFRDMRYLLPFLNQIVFFITPVFWPYTKVVGWRSHLVNFNPFFGLMEMIRSPLLGSAPPEIVWILGASSLGVGAVLWFLFFSLFRGRIAFWV